MEQKYVLAINAKREISIIVATPENLAAYILRNAPGEVTITTLSGDVILEAYHGDICRCFDMDHLINSIYRVIFDVQAGKRPLPEVRYASSPIQPMGSEEKNITPCAGQSCASPKQQTETLTKFKGHRVTLTVGVYYHSGNLSLKLITLDEGEPRPEDFLTTNLPRKRPRNCAYINMMRYGSEVTNWLRENHLAERTGRRVDDGRNSYLEYRFAPERLRGLDAAGYEKYVGQFSGGRRCYG